MITVIRELYSLGAWEFYGMLLMGIFGLAVCIDRFYQLYFKQSVDAKKFFAELQKRVMADKIDDAIRLCSDAPLPQVVKAGLMKAEMGVKLDTAEYQGMIVACDWRQAIITVEPPPNWMAELRPARLTPAAKTWFSIARAANSVWKCPSRTSGHWDG